MRRDTEEGGGGETDREGDGKTERAERLKMRDQSVCGPAEGGQGENI